MPPIPVAPAPRVYSSAAVAHGSSKLMWSEVSTTSPPFILLGIEDTRPFALDTSTDLVNWSPFRSNLVLTKLIRVPATNGQAYFRLREDTNCGTGVFLSTNFQFNSITNL